MNGKPIRGYLVCRKCGKREAQSVYDCDVPIICKSCDPATSMVNSVVPPKPQEVAK